MYVTYILTNGLDTAEDPVIRKYSVQITGGEEGQENLLKTRVSGKLMWAVGSVIRLWANGQSAY